MISRTKPMKRKRFHAHIASLTIGTEHPNQMYAILRTCRVLLRVAKRYCLTNEGAMIDCEATSNLVEREIDKLALTVRTQVQREIEKLAVTWPLESGRKPATKHTPARSKKKGKAR
jgi:hypothetical protein